MTIDTAAAIAALGARTAHPQRLPARLLVGTDSRSVAAGSTYLVLRGERFDGHAFIAEAFTRGAAACIVSDASAIPSAAPALVVEDTLRAYLQLARLARAQTRGPLVAISGSTGKTTTKALLVQLLAAAGVAVVGTPENENNEVGVSKFLLGLEPDDARVMVVEMGARKFGDIDVLIAAAQPDIAVLTNIGDAHLQIMGSRERLADTKWGLFRSGARAVLNLDDANSRQRAPQLAAAAVWFGVGAAVPPAGALAAVVRDAHTLVTHDAAGSTEHAIDARLPGDHNRLNLAAALAAALALGLAPALLAPHVATLGLPSGRYEIIALGGGRRLIFDAYNASLSGTLATLDAFAVEPATRRIAVLGSMAELGADAPAMHRRVGAAAAASSEIVLAGGDFAAEIAGGFAAAGGGRAPAVTYGENAAAVAWLRANTRAGDAILLKGSRKYKMEEIAAALTSESDL